MKRRIKILLLFIPIGLVLFSKISYGAIAYDNSYYASSLASSPSTISYTNNGDFLIVFTQKYGGALADITSMTYNGAALTKKVAYTNATQGGGGTRNEVWSLSNAPAGTYNLVITWTGTDLEAQIHSYSGTDTAEAVESVASSSMTISDSSTCTGSALSNPAGSYVEQNGSTCLFGFYATTTNAGDMLVGYREGSGDLNIKNNTSTFDLVALNGSTTLRQSYGTNTGFGSVDSNVGYSAVGAHSLNYIWAGGASHDFNGTIVAIKPAASAGALTYSVSIVNDCSVASSSFCYYTKNFFMADYKNASSGLLTLYVATSSDIFSATTTTAIEQKSFAYSSAFLTANTSSSGSLILNQDLSAGMVPGSTSTPMYARLTFWAYPAVTNVADDQVSFTAFSDVPIATGYATSSVAYYLNCEGTNFTTWGNCFANALIYVAQILFFPSGNSVSVLGASVSQFKNIPPFNFYFDVVGGIQTAISDASSTATSTLSVSVLGMNGSSLKLFEITSSTIKEKLTTTHCDSTCAQGIKDMFFGWQRVIIWVGTGIGIIAMAS